MCIISVQCIVNQRRICEYVTLRIEYMTPLGQKQVSMVWISNNVPQYCGVCYYLFMPFIRLTSYWAGQRLKSPAWRLSIQPFIQTQIKENIKAPPHWPLCGEFTGTGDFPAQKASNAANVSIWWRHDVIPDFGTKSLCNQVFWYIFLIILDRVCRIYCVDKNLTITPLFDNIMTKCEISLHGKLMMHKLTP